MTEATRKKLEQQIAMVKAGHRMRIVPPELVYELWEHCQLLEEELDAMYKNPCAECAHKEQLDHEAMAVETGKWDQG